MADVYRDPMAVKVRALREGQLSQTMGLIGVWPSDVDGLKRRLDPSMRATDAAVKNCARLAPGERKAWEGFFAAWESTFAESTPIWLGLGEKYDEIEHYRQQLGGWQEELRAKCEIPGPKVSTEEPGAGTASVIKWVAAAAIAISVVYGVKVLASATRL